MEEGKKGGGPLRFFFSRAVRNSICELSAARTSPHPLHVLDCREVTGVFIGRLVNWL